MKCIDKDDHCCPYGLDWCPYTEECTDHCCVYNGYSHEVWCDIHNECRDECDCCDDGFEACECESGIIGTNRECFSVDSQECCNDIWCEKCEECVLTDK